MRLLAPEAYGTAPKTSRNRTTHPRGCIYRCLAVTSVAYPQRGVFFTLLASRSLGQRTP